MSSMSVSRRRLLGSILLVAGCCIGTGMLGLPILSASAGWWPSVLSLFWAWAFMNLAGWVLIDVAMNFPKDTSVIQMAHTLLGRVGATIAWVCWIFLLYTIMVACALGTGQLAQDLLLPWISIAPGTGSFVFCFILAFTLVYGTRACDALNRILMIGLVTGYALLIYFGFPHVTSFFLLHRDWTMIWGALPIFVLSFGYHNLIPTLVHYLDHNRSALRYAILVGSSIPLVVYLLWQYISLGNIPLHAFESALQTGTAVTVILQETLQHPAFSLGARLFAFSAITTTFVAMALSMMDFWKESLRLNPTWAHRWLVCLLVLLPVIGIAWTYPSIFLKALTYAAAYGALILFGVLPSLMRLKEVPGEFSKILLPYVVLVTSVAMILIQIRLDLNF